MPCGDSPKSDASGGGRVECPLFDLGEKGTHPSISTSWGRHYVLEGMRPGMELIYQWLSSISFVRHSAPLKTRVKAKPPPVRETPGFLDLPAC